MGLLKKKCKQFILLSTLFLNVLMLSAANKKVLVIAHRGASELAPENTKAAIKKALEIGVDMIEIDVHQTRDGKIILLHDETVNRTTNGKGKVKDLTFDEISKLDAGSWFSEHFKGETVPALEEILNEISGKARLLIEVKKDSRTYPGIEKNIMDLIQKHNASSWCIIQSFETRVLKNFLELKDKVEMHKLVTGDVPVLPLHVDAKIQTGSIYQYDYVASINLFYKFLTKRKINRIHNQGQKVFTWTVNGEEDMRRMIKMGVDGIITNRPDVLKKILNE
jgi:glycerophosphoryl diester phosphodiesterase